MILENISNNIGLKWLSYRKLLIGEGIRQEYSGDQNIKKVILD